MSKIEALSRYNLIINRVRKSPATLKEIREYLQRESEIQGYNFDVSDRTFKRDLNDIWSLYKIEISYDSSRRVYQINLEESPDLNSRMLEAFDTLNALNVASGLSEYVYFESRKPQGTENFHGLLHAIKNTQLIIFSYLKYWTGTVSIRKVLPYALKEFKGRWYLIAKDENDGWTKTFGLDRIADLEITKKKFVNRNKFNVAELFEECFGIINPIEGEAENVVLSFDADQGKYIKSFPLHRSQRILVDSNEQLRISLHVYVTHDLVMEVLSYGCRVRVIAPEKLRKEVLANYEKAALFYK
ncbi:MAG: helix-turn-helix transcriptional regulator [Arcticibacter sp.]